jgi:GTP diphosphokinase / guanosine-3',5'-bis(diphosphate) 3'-diphosphatase
LASPRITRRAISPYLARRCPIDINLGRPAFVGGDTVDPATGTITRMLGRAQEQYQRVRSSMWAGRSDDPITELLREHRKIHPRGDVRQVRRGYEIAERMHRGQMRKSGEEYITHPLAVARTLAELGMDTTTLVAALLHDTVEDTAYDLRTLAEDFGGEVALLVDGVTKLDKAYFGDDAEIETIRKMLVKAGQDVRVLVIKLADRLHNMRTLDARSPASRARIARATEDVLVPLSDRLGIQALKRELEDAVLATLEPEAYGQIHKHVSNRPLWAHTLEATIDDVQVQLAKAKIDATVLPRPRHYYSIWKDTIAKKFPLSYDLPRIVIVIDGPRNDCYTALGTLHATWHPVPGRFKDFIASPKNNLYRSLHTTVIGPDNKPVEVLIRTVGMHHFAEYGIVANYRDPQGTAKLEPRDRDEQLSWLRRVVNWQHVADDAGRFLDALRCDLSEAQIQVFTANGQGVLLPSGSTPVDVAFTVDPDLGHACVAATVNGRLVRLESVLDDGDVVEILTRDPEAASLGIGAGPAREWLDFVKSPQARLEITRWFATASEVSPAVPSTTVNGRVRSGRNAITTALRAQERYLPDDSLLHVVAMQLDYPDLDAMLVAIADERLVANDVAGRLIAYADHPTPSRGAL